MGVSIRVPGSLCMQNTSRGYERCAGVATGQTSWYTGLLTLFLDRRCVADGI